MNTQDDLLEYYRRELAYLRVQGGDFVPEQGVFFPEGFEFFEDFSDQVVDVHLFLKGVGRAKEARGHCTGRPEAGNPRTWERPAGKESTGGLIVKSTRLSAGRTYVRSGLEEAVARGHHEAVIFCGRVFWSTRIK